MVWEAFKLRKMVWEALIQRPEMVWEAPKLPEIWEALKWLYAGIWKPEMVWEALF